MIVFDGPRRVFPSELACTTCAALHIPCLIQVHDDGSYFANLRGCVWCWSDKTGVANCSHLLPDAREGIDRGLAVIPLEQFRALRRDAIDRFLTRDVWPAHMLVSPHVPPPPVAPSMPSRVINRPPPDSSTTAAPRRSAFGWGTGSAPAAASSRPPRVIGATRQLTATAPPRLNGVPHPQPHAGTAPSTGMPAGPAVVGAPAAPGIMSTQHNAQPGTGGRYPPPRLIRPGNGMNVLRQSNPTPRIVTPYPQAQATHNVRINRGSGSYRGPMPPSHGAAPPRPPANPYPGTTPSYRAPVRPPRLSTTPARLPPAPQVPPAPYNERGNLFRPPSVVIPPEARTTPNAAISALYGQQYHYGPPPQDVERATGAGPGQRAPVVPTSEPRRIQRYGDIARVPLPPVVEAPAAVPTPTHPPLPSSAAAPPHQPLVLSMSGTHNRSGVTGDERGQPRPSRPSGRTPSSNKSNQPSEGPNNFQMLAEEAERVLRGALPLMEPPRGVKRVASVQVGPDTAPKKPARTNSNTAAGAGGAPFQNTPGQRAIQALGGAEGVAAAHNGSTSYEHNAAIVDDASSAVQHTTDNGSAAVNNDTRATDNATDVNDANSPGNTAANPITMDSATPSDSHPHGAFPPNEHTALKPDAGSNTPMMNSLGPTSTGEPSPAENPVANSRHQHRARSPSPASAQFYAAMDEPGMPIGQVPTAARAGLPAIHAPGTPHPASTSSTQETQSSATDTQPTETQSSSTTQVSTPSQDPVVLYNFVLIGSPWAIQDEPHSWYSVELPQPKKKRPPPEFHDSNWALGGWRGWHGCMMTCKTRFTRQTRITRHVIDLIRAARKRDVDPALNDEYTVDLNTDLQSKRTILPDLMFTAAWRCHRCRENGALCFLWDLEFCPEKGMIHKLCLGCKAANEVCVFDDEEARTLLTAQEVRELTPSLEYKPEPTWKHLFGCDCSGCRS